MPVLPGYESKGKEVMINNFFALFILEKIGGFDMYRPLADKNETNKLLEFAKKDNKHIVSLKGEYGSGQCKMTTEYVTCNKNDGNCKTCTEILVLQMECPKMECDSKDL